MINGLLEKVVLLDQLERFNRSYMLAHSILDYSQHSASFINRFVISSELS